MSYFSGTFSKKFCESDDRRRSNKPEPLHNDFWDTLYLVLHLLSGLYPCGYICQLRGQTATNMHLPSIYFEAGGQLMVQRCDGIKDCLNTDLDERYCEDVPVSSKICDLTCETTDFCTDESVCNGLFYGICCGGYSANEDAICVSSTYVKAVNVCDGKETCPDGADEKHCTINETTPTCFNLQTNVTSRLHNFTRCGPRFLDFRRIGIETYSFLPFCEDFMDQTNCTDNERIGLECPVKGYTTTIAKQMICPNKERYDLGLHNAPQICDDGLDKACFQLSPTCNMHKHLLCNYVTDCPNEEDENHEDCNVMTIKECIRKYRTQNQKEMPLPLAWAKDGVFDCLDGSDESQDWPTCGKGRTFRIILDEDIKCNEVLLCQNDDRKFVSFDNLCDRRETCGDEINVCSVSRMQYRTFSVAVRDNQDMKVMLLHCVRGLTELSHFRRDMKCSSPNFHFPLRTGTFGWNKTLELNVPARKQDCRHLYGEYYVFLSCLGLCMGAVCPVTRPIRWNSCPGPLENMKLFTVDKDGHLAFLINERNSKKPGTDLFLCKNTKCVSYDKVCNLEDDCGDFSDESMCVNHFKCATSGEYLPIVDKCDGKIHCFDKSDECNDSCGKQVVSNSFLKVVGWISGIAAFLLNSVSLFNGISTLKTCESEPGLLNKFLVILVGVGDMLIGVYLIAISIYDRRLSDNYCYEQFNWLSSDTCVALGIISTMGSQLSLFSMTSLSLLRVSGIKKSLSVPEEKTKKSWMKLAAIASVIIFITSTISCLPLMATFEDFFVNGLKYGDDNSLFTGCPGKVKHMNIIQAYYGRIMTDSLTWSQINVLVDDMFSKDYGGISRNRLSFYGNDPTCLFKYFVTREDPQMSFVFSVLCLNFLCFIVITCSYVTIVLKTKRSAKRLLEIASKNAATNSQAKKRNAQLQRVTQWIILTDFVCWVPFIVICSLHFLDNLDATPWYPYFSLLILPINSVINPLLYDVSLRHSFYTCFDGLNYKIRPICVNLSGLMKFDGDASNNAANHHPEEIELAVRPPRNQGAEEHIYTNKEAVKLQKVQEQPREEIEIQEQVQELPREEIEIQEQVQEQPREEIEIQEQVQELPREEIEIQEQVQELPREEIKIQEQVQELPREEIEEQVQELPREEIEIQEQVQELPREEIEIQEQV